MEREIDNPEDHLAIAVVDVIDGSCSTVGRMNLVWYCLISWTTGEITYQFIA